MAPDILAFDAVSQLPLKGLDAYSTHGHACRAMCRPGTMIVEMHDVHVAAGDDVLWPRHSPAAAAAEQTATQRLDGGA